MARTQSSNASSEIHHEYEYENDEPASMRQDVLSIAAFDESDSDYASDTDCNSQPAQPECAAPLIRANQPNPNTCKDADAFPDRRSLPLPGKGATYPWPIGL